MKKIIVTIIVSLTLMSALFADMSPEVKNALKAAKNGNPTAQALIGLAYYGGRDGCVQSFEKAYPWLLKSAKNGMRESFVLSHLAGCIFASKSFQSYTKEFFILAHEAAADGDSFAIGILKDLKLFRPNYKKNPKDLRKAINSLPPTLKF